MILSRFDRLDEKFDKQATELSSIASRVTAVETKVDPLVDEAKFQSRVKVLGHVLTSAITLGIMGVVRLLWPAHVPPPSILGK